MTRESSSRDVFVGRQREMAQLTAALEDAIAGHGSLLMLVGEPGIGKTRTAEELAMIATERKMQVLWGRCPEDVGAPPFWPWTQAIRALTAQLSGDWLREGVGAPAPLRRAGPA